MWLLWMLSVGAWACDAASLADSIRQAETAFNTMDAISFDQSVARAHVGMACQREPLTPVQCAAYHRLRALEAFLAEDESGTILAFQAVLSTQPGYQLSEAIAPLGHPLRDQLELARQYDTPETFALPPPADGWLQVDGRRSGSAPAGRPFVFQSFASVGTVVHTRYLPVGSPMPVYDVAAPTVVALPAPVSAKTTEPRVERTGPNMALLGTGIAIGIASVGLYAGAFSARASYDGAVIAGDERRIRSNLTTTNALTIGSLSAAGLGTTLAVAGLL